MDTAVDVQLPAWATWRGSTQSPFTLGVEEEVMLVAGPGWNIAQAIDEVMPRLPEQFVRQFHRETHAGAVELATGVHESAAGAATELRELRQAIRTTVGELDLAVASAGTHPFTVWREVAVSRGARQDAVYGSMRELARREPTFALHVHVGVSDPEDAMKIANRLRVHVPLLLALSANSPFWQGRDTGLASARTPLFQAFPRVGIPRAFEDYAEWARTVDLMVRCEAFDDATYLWWDVRLQPRLGTVEVRIMDAQITLEATVALVALVQCLARLECFEGWAPQEAIDAVEVLAENRFLAARDGVEVGLIDPVAECRVPLRQHLNAVLAACRPHAQDLGCEAELELVHELFAKPGARCQLDMARGPGRLPGLVSGLADQF